MERSRSSYEYLQRQTADQGISPAGTVLYGIAVIYIIHQALAYFDYPLLSPQKLLWNAIVYVLPKYLLLDSARREQLRANGMLSQTHAAKSDALRRMLGMGGSAMMQSMPAGGIMRRASTGLFSRPAKVTTDAPPGLGNWDNSCYQNSVLQGLASLDSLKPFLERTTEQTVEDSGTSGSLLETVGKLKNAENNGKQLWTPGKLKSMSSWQQQDAQEYFSKIMDVLDKEAAKATTASNVKPGLETIADELASGKKDDETAERQAARNPMEGLIAQKVACTKCGFSEGLSLIPFNCLTVPLGSNYAYDLDDCLDEYTKLEEISDVECAKCTLLRAERQLTAMLPQAPTNGDSPDKEPAVDSKVLALPPELRAQAFKRLSAIQAALSEDDLDDKTIAEKCEIGKKARVSSTKTRQAVVARAPHSLVIHVNRSVFDEMTGAQRKNHATVRWPGELDLGEWMLRAGKEGGVSLLGGDEDAVKTRYRIKAVVTHYGRHENGHYICYRRHPVHVREAAVVEEEDVDDELEDQKLEERWWRLSDEDVSSVSEGEVLGQGGVFMLFYERIEEPALLAQDVQTQAIASEAAAESADAGTPLPTAHAEAKHIVPASEVPANAPAGTAAPEPLATASVPDKSDGAAGIPAEAAASAASTIEDPVEDAAQPASEEPAQAARKSPSPPFMRTARGRQASKSEQMEGFGGMGGMRAMAAT